MEFRYFGRTGGSELILAIYRIRSELYDGKLDFQHFKVIELLLPNESWKSGDFERLETDWMHGWFDEHDELSEEKAQQLIAEWRDKGWPARR